MLVEQVKEVKVEIDNIIGKKIPFDNNITQLKSGLGIFLEIDTDCSGHKDRMFVMDERECRKLTIETYNDKGYAHVMLPYDMRAWVFREYRCDDQGILRIIIINRNIITGFICDVDGDINEQGDVYYRDMLEKVKFLCFEV